MKLAIAAVATLAVAANARSVPQAMPCPTTPVPKPTTTMTPTGTAAPVKIPAVCSNLPTCIDGVMVPGHAYSVEPALWDCAKRPNCKTMRMWCEPKKVIKNAKDAFDFWYACEEVPAIPKNTTCKINGDKRTVGVAYKNLKVDGKKFDYVWCLDSKTVVSCSGKKCGSTAELTPPGIKVDQKCLKPVEPVKPVVPRPEQCMDCATCTAYGFKWSANRCAAQCAMDVACAATPAQCQKPSKPVVPRPEQCWDCKTCTSYGYKWSANRCAAQCAMDVACASAPAQCNAVRPPTPEMVLDPECAACVGDYTEPHTYEFSSGVCLEGAMCPRIAGAECAYAQKECYRPVIKF